ncbi:MAG: hypothetical protein KAQ62_04475 [Cyclobacteriaceae bacterium]|nr:hypothetical protein [Cyclobacteriaceae bacterium]
MPALNLATSSRLISGFQHLLNQYTDPEIPVCPASSAGGEAGIQDDPKPGFEILLVLKAISLLNKRKSSIISRMTLNLRKAIC